MSPEKSASVRRAPVATNPAATPPSPSPLLRLIDQRESLRSLIRVWLATRDQLLWAFASGADESIANIDLDAAMPIAAELNACRLSIVRTAKKLAEIEKSDKSVEGLIKEAADEVLATERPMFVLDNGQGTF